MRTIPLIFLLQFKLSNEINDMNFPSIMKKTAALNFKNRNIHAINGSVYLQITNSKSEIN